jgi:hypothetical protein
MHAPVLHQVQNLPLLMLLLLQLLLLLLLARLVLVLLLKKPKPLHLQLPPPPPGRHFHHLKAVSQTWWQPCKVASCILDDSCPLAMA